MLKFHAREVKNLDIKIPVFSVQGEKEKVGIVKIAGEQEKQENEIVARELTKKYYKIDKIVRGEVTKIEGLVLYIREGIEKDIIEKYDDIKDFSIRVITEKEYHTYSDTIMDIQPIATKAGEDVLGNGTTNVLDGVVALLSGVDENGVQVGEFGSSEGYLDENIMWNRPGCPDKGDIILQIHAVIPQGKTMERPGPFAVHQAADEVLEEIRKELKKIDIEKSVRQETFRQIKKRKYKVVLIKEVMGQGAMHDNLLLPIEPVGILGGVSNIDMGNLPVCMNPLEVLDGGIHALTCVGPASKEVSRHYFREPLVEAALQEEEFEVCGVIVVGSSQINTEKYYSSKRLGMMVETMGVDGAIITTEGFGNNHIDFSSHHEQLGMRGIPVVGMSFCAVQGALVVGNKYMSNMIELNKSPMGVENEVLACNTLCREDALRAIVMLKNVLKGVEIEKADKKWSLDTKNINLEQISSKMEEMIEPVKDETTLPLSQKRKEKYGIKED